MNRIQERRAYRRSNRVLRLWERRFFLDDTPPRRTFNARLPEKTFRGRLSNQLLAARHRLVALEIREIREIREMDELRLAREQSLDTRTVLTERHRATSLS